MTNRKFLSFLLAIFMFFSTITPLFAENDSVTVLPPRMAEKEEPQNVVIMENDKDTIPIIDKSEEGGKKIEETPEEPEIKEDNSPVILENREENNNIVILPPIKNEENKEGTTEPSKETEEPEEPKKEKENKKEVKVQVLSKRDAKKPASEGEVNLVLLNDNPADINEEVYDEKIRWKESDFKIEDDKIISLSDEGLLKVARNKKLIIPEMENITIIEKEAFKGLSLRSVEIPKNIKEIKDEAFKDNPLSFVKILGKGKEISKNAFNEELLEMYKKSEEEEFLYECEDELEIGKEIVGDAVGAVAPDDVSLYTFSGGTITGLSEKGKNYYADNHDMVLPVKSPQGQLINEIGEKAFYDDGRGYGLRSVDFSNCTNLLTIRNYAFSNNKLTSLDLSKCANLSSIGNYAFNENQFILIDLYECKNLKSIGNFAFYGNELTRLSLSGCTSLTTIGSYAFYNNKLTNIDLSGCTNLTSIEHSTFSYNNLTSLDLSKCTSLKSIGNYAFNSNELKTAKIPLSLTTLADNAFIYNPGNNTKRQVYLSTPDYTNPNNLKDSAYHLINPIEGRPDNPSLYTFSGTTITGLSEEGKTYYATNHDIVLPGKNPQGQAITAIGPRAFYNGGRGYGLTSVDFSNCASLIGIGGDAFNYNNLTKLDLSRCTNLIGIGETAFHNNQLTSLDLSGCINLTIIGVAAFYKNQLANLNLSGCTNLKSIDSHAFGNNKLTNLDLSGCKNLISIGETVFHNNQLKVVSIPLSLNNLTYDAFKNNPGNNDKKQVYLYTPDKTNPNNLQDSDYHLINPVEKVSPDDVSLYTFSGTTITGLSEKGKIYYATNHDMVLPGKNPQGQVITAIGNSAFQSNKLSSLDFSRCTSLTTIGSYAFCSNYLSALDLSGCTSLTDINHYAFRYNKLKAAKIPLSLSILSEFAFKDNLGNNYNKQVYLFTPDYTNPHNLKSSSYHLINPAEGIYDVSLYTFSGTTITGLSEKGKTYYATNHNMILPGKNPRGQAVTAIESGAFYNGRKGYGLTSVNFSYCTSLTSIGVRAFYQNQLTSLDLSKCTKLKNIGDYAFNKNKLTNLDLSRCTRLASIGEGAFCENQLTSLDLSRCTSLTNIGPGAFYQNKLTSLDLSRCTSLTSIGPTAFCRNQLTSLDLSGCTSLTSIGISAFTGSKLKTAKIPLSLATLSDDAFKENLGNNDKKQVYLYTPDYTNPNNLQDSDHHLINPLTGSDDVSLYTFNGTIITGLSERGKKYFAEHHEMVLPGKNPQGQDVTAIGKGAFNNKDSGYGLTSVDFKNLTHLAKIGESSFSRNKLKNLNLSGCTSLTSIGDSAFQSNQLTSLNLSSCTTLTSIGNSAFYSNNLTALNLSECANLKSIGDYVFSNNKIANLDLSKNTNLEQIGTNAFGSNELTSLDLSKCVTLKQIGDRAFEANLLASLNLSGCASLLSIGEEAFHLNMLTSLNLSGCTSLTSIGNSAFWQNQLTNLDLSGCTSLTSIGNYAFNSSQLATLDLSGCINLISIGSYSFSGNQLKTVKIPLGLKTLSEVSFSGNPGNNDKKQVYLYTPDYTNPNNLKDSDYHLINPITGPDDVSLYRFNGTTIAGLSERGKKYFETHHEMILPGKNPQGQDITAIGDSAFYDFGNGNGYGLTSVDFKNCTNLTSIGRYAFGNNKLTSADFKNLQNLVSIGANAFANNQLTSVDLSGCTNLTSIGSYAFNKNQFTSLDLSGCTNLTSIGYGAFSSNQLTSLDLSGCTNLATIDDYAFAVNKLINIDLSRCISLKSIGSHAFNYNQLKTAKISLSLVSLADDAFINNPGNNDKKQVYLYTPNYTNPNNLQDTTYHLINPITGSDDVSLYTFNGTTITGLTERGKTYFKKNPNLVLPGKNPEGQSIIAIGPNAFSPEEYDENYPVFESVDFSNCSSLLAIGNGAFAGHYFDKLDLSPCTSLIAIGDSAFAFSEGSHGPEDKDIEVSFRGLKNLKTIGGSAFAGPDIGNRVGKIDFSGCTGLETIGEGAFFWSRIENLDLSPCTNLKTIKKMAFAGIDLKTLNLSGCKNLITIEKAAFNSNKLSSIDFSGCSNLQTIGSYAFGSSHLETLDLSECTSLEVIEKHAFYNNNINIAHIPLSLTILADDAFQENPGNNDKKQVYLYTPDKTNPNNLKDTDYHLINPETKPDDFNLYTFDGTTITGLTEEGKKYYETHHDMVLPGKTPNGKDVTGIGKSAFYNLGLTSLDLSKMAALTTLGQGAFSSNNIASLDLSKNTNLQTIENDVFYKNQISSLNLSGLTKLTSIGDWAFGRNKLTSLDLSPLTALTTIGGDSFRENQIATLNMSGLKSLELIKRGAFYSNKLTNLDLTECTNLKSINEVAFNNNLLTDVNMSGLKNLQNIDSIAFGSNQISNLNMANMTGLKTIGQSAFDGNKLSMLDLSTLTGLESIGNYAFYQNNLKTAKIPLSVKTIEAGVFKNNPGSNDRKQVYLYTLDYTNPNNLPDTDYHLINPITGSDDVTLYTFDGTTITGLTDRGKKYFKEHHDMVLPGKNPEGQSITEIGDWAFNNKSTGTGIGVTSVDFSNCRSLKAIGIWAFYKNQLSSINLSECIGLTSIGSYAFRENQLTSLDLSGCSNLTSIGESAFSYNKLTSLDLSGCKNLTDIGSYAFRENQLTTLDLSGCVNLKSIGVSGFMSNKLKTVKIPYGITSINKSSFAYNLGNNAKKQVYLYTPMRNNPQNLSDTDYHLVDPITFTIKKVDAKGKPMEGVEFAFYKVERPTPPAPPAPPQNGANKTENTELEISSENIPSTVGGPSISMPDIDLELITDGPRPEFFPDPKTVVGVKPIFMTATTDKNGKAEITLPYSPYFLVENKTIPGYSINNTVTQIDATMEGKTIIYTDYEVSIEIPETGTLGTLPYILLALILVGGAYVVLRKKKEENK